VAEAGNSKQTVAGAVRITIASSLRRLWTTWQDVEHARRLAANDEQVKAFAQAGLREATGIATLLVVAVSGGPSDWWVSYEIPAPGMDVTSAYSLSDQVQQKLSQLQDTNSPEFAAFARGASVAGYNLQLQSVVIVSSPSVRSQDAQSEKESFPNEVSRAMPGMANAAVPIALLPVFVVVVSGCC